MFSFGHFRICDKSARDGKGEIEKQKRDREKPKISFSSNVKNAGKSLVRSCPCAFV